MSNQQSNADNGFEYKIMARLFSVVGIAVIAIYLALTVVTSWGGWTSESRLSLGCATTIGALALGHLLRRTRVSWLGICFTTAGYALGYFFSFAAHYIDGLNVLSDPVHSWLAMLAVALALTLHGIAHRMLSWFAVPATLLMGGLVTYLSLAHPGSLVIGSYSIEMSVAGSIGGLLWSALMTLIYRTQCRRYQTRQNEETQALYWVYRIAHELYFVTAALSAMALVFFCKLPANMPFVWALEGLFLLVLTWKEGSNFKVSVVAAMQGAATVLLFSMLNPNNFFGAPSTLSMLGVPCILLLVSALSRLVCTERWTGLHHQSAVLMHRLYGVAGLATGTFFAFWVFHAWGAVPILLCAYAVLVLVSLAFGDILAHRLSYAYFLLTVAVYAFCYGSWNWPMLIALVAVFFAASALYWRVFALGGWKQSDWELALVWKEWNGYANGYTTVVPKVVEKEEAYFLTHATAVIAYLALTVGLGVLLPGWGMACGWAVAAVFATAAGLGWDKVGHIAVGGALLALAILRVFILDLIMAHSPLVESKIAFGIIGVCFLVCASLHAWKRVRLNGKL